MLKLINGHQNYEWGKPSKDSVIFQIQSNFNKIDPNIPYAELWLGTHVNLTSKTLQGESLIKLIEENPKKMLGKLIDLFPGKLELPFLFKILTVGKCLSIQAHPDKELANILHLDKPQLYKDGNYKPEMAIAISEFEAFSNFAEKNIIIKNFEEYKEFKEIFSKEKLEIFYEKSISEEKSREILKELINELLNTDEEFIAKQIRIMIERLEKKEFRTERDELNLRINNQFKGDMGIFFTLFMNYLKMKPGDCLVMHPNEPHAYLGGDCIECKIKKSKIFKFKGMANSDNVVRAGLTPKFKDKETLYNMMTYKMGESTLITPQYLSKNNNEKLYQSIYREFQCISIELDKNMKSSTFKFEYPFIGIVLKGNGKIVYNESNKELQSDIINQFESFYLLPYLEFNFIANDFLKIFLCGSF